MDGIEFQPPTSGRRELVEYLEAPLRRPLVALVPFVLIVTAAVVAGFLAPKRYQSSTLILAEPDKVPDSFVTKVSTESAQKRLDTLRQEIMSRTRLERVIRDVDPYSETAGNEPLSDTLDRMRSSISISVKGNDAFAVEFVHTQPHKAMQVANRIATLFIEEAAKQREEQVEEAYEFIDSALQEARRQLEQKEEAVRRYKESHMGTLPEQLSANLSTLQGLQTQQQTLAESVRAARERQSALERNLSDQLRGTGTPGTVSLDPFTEINQLRSQLAALRGRYTDEHPDVKLLLSRLASLEKSLEGTSEASKSDTSGVDPAATLIRAQLEQVKREVAALQTKQADLDQRIAVYQARVEMGPRTEQEVATLTRDYQKLKDNYFSLLSKKHEAQMAAKLEQRWKGVQFRILDPAHVPERPVFPKRSLFVMAGIVLGLVVGLGAALAVEALDHSVKSVRELGIVLPYPLLATIPHVDLRHPAASLRAREMGAGGTSGSAQRTAHE